MIETNETDFRVSEYESLRAELLQNKQFVFERPLVILAAAGVAAVEAKDPMPLLVLCLFVEFVLAANLWFTVNRLRSNARIAGYIAIALEGRGVHPWIGWENALRMHRKWTQSGVGLKVPSREGPDKEPEKVPDAMAFYPALLTLHIVPAMFAFGASVIVLWDPSLIASNGNALTNVENTVGICLSTLTVVVTMWLACLCLGPYRPHRMAHLVERQRTAWCEVLCKYTNGNAEDARVNE